MNNVFKNAVAKAEDSFNDAKLLLSHERYSAAINRCYYAVYYLSNAMLLEKEIHVKMHSGVIRKFSEIFEKRQVADYDMEYHIHFDEAEQTLKDAREFIDTIKEIVLNRNKI